MKTKTEILTILQREKPELMRRYGVKGSPFLAPMRARTPDGAVGISAKTAMSISWWKSSLGFVELAGAN
jgi:hypothetical protein